MLRRECGRIFGKETMTGRFVEGAMQNQKGFAIRRVARSVGEEIADLAMGLRERAAYARVEGPYGVVPEQQYGTREKSEARDCKRSRLLQRGEFVCWQVRA